MDEKSFNTRAGVSVAKFGLNVPVLLILKVFGDFLRISVFSIWQHFERAYIDKFLDAFGQIFIIIIIIPRWANIEKIIMPSI